MNKRGEDLKDLLKRSWLSFKGTGTVFFEDSGISLISFIEKSYVNFKGISLIVFSEKSCMIFKGFPL